MCKKRAAQIFAIIMLGMSMMGAGIQENQPESKGSTHAHEMETEITISQQRWNVSGDLSGSLVHDSGKRMADWRVQPGGSLD